MLYVLRARVVETVEKPIEVEADSIEEAKELIEEAISDGEITIEGSQVANVEFEKECNSSYHGHRWEHSPHEDKMFCKYCGMLEADYKAIEL
jgi:hypothetical protein